MKQNLLVLWGIIALLFIKTSYLYSQTITIDSARTIAASFTANQTGGSVTVAGIATNGNELGPIRYMQDGTGGLSAYGTTLSTVNPGDSILVTGTLTNYNSLVEIEVTAVQVISVGNPLPAPIVFSGTGVSSAFAEAYEGQLVELDGVTSITTSGGASITTFSGNTSYKLNGITKEVLYIKSGSTGTNGIVGAAAPSGTFSVIGIMSQFSSSSISSGYEFLPRVYSDFILSGAPNISSPVSVTNLTTTSLTLNFTTVNNGDTKIVYGTTTAFGDTMYSPDLVTNHSIALSTLTPATVYYVKAFSTNSVGTSTTSSVVTLITASNSTGDIKIYFNNKDADNSFALPGNNAIALNGLIDDTLINYINRAKYSLDIAMYDWNNNGLSNMTAAVNNAYARGVQVRVVGDGSTGNSGIYSLNSNIGKIFSPTTSAYGIMHNKFMIIDGKSTNPNDPIVWTGSTNWTEEQIDADNNNLIIIQDQSLAIAYIMEFEEMFGSASAQPNAVVSKFGPFKSDIVPHYFNIAGNPIQLYFSPSDGVTNKIINTIGSADHDFEFATMVLTRSDIATALKNKYVSLADSCSGGILDDTSDGSGPYFTIKNVMNDRIKIYTGSYIMHSKYIIIDEGDTTSDPIVLSGSHNWSTDAETKNDENTLIIHNAKIANKYYQNFAAVYKGAKGLTCNYYCSATPIVNAGADQLVCSGAGLVSLDGTITNSPSGIWTTSGTGTFSPDNTTLTASYTPSSADISNGSVSLTLTATGTSCSTVSDKMIVTISGCTGINSGLTNNVVYIYPNPVSTSFKLNSNTNSNIILLEILDSQGKLVRSDANNLTEYNVSDLLEGLYFVKAYFSDNTFVVNKMIVLK